MDFLFVPSGKGFKKIRLSSLLYIKAGAVHTELVTTEGSVLTAVSLAQLEKSLRTSRFCRVHTDYLVALDKLIAFDRHIVELPGICLPLEKKFIGALKESIRIIDPFEDPLGYQSLAVDAGGKLSRI